MPKTATREPTSAEVQARIAKVQAGIEAARARREQLELEIANAIRAAEPADQAEAELARVESRLRASDLALSALDQDLNTAQRQEALADLRPLAVALAEARQVHEAAGAELEAAESALNDARDRAKAARQDLATVEFNVRAAAHRARTLGATDEEIRAIEQG